MISNKKPEVVGVGWLSQDKSYIKLRLLLGPEPIELIVKRSKLTEKRSEGQADYLVYPKPEQTQPKMDF